MSDKNTSVDIRVGADIADIKAKLKQLSGQTKQLTNTIKSQFDGLKNSVSNFGLGLNEITGGASGMISGLVEGFQKAIGGINGTTTATKLLKKALIASGIGALVVALGSLASYLTSTVDGNEQLRKSMNRVKAVTNTLKEEFVGLGRKIVDAFTKKDDGEGSPEGFGKRLKDAFLLPIQIIKANLDAFIDVVFAKFKLVGAAIGNLFKKDENKIDLEPLIADIEAKQERMVEVFTKTVADPIKAAVDKGKAYFSELGEEIKKNIALADLQTAKENKLYKTRLANATELVDLENEVWQAREKFASTGEDLDARIQAGDEALKLQRELVDRKKAEKQLEIDILALKQAQGSKNEEANLAMAQMIGELKGYENQYAAFAKEIVATKSGMIKQHEDEVAAEQALAAEQKALSDLVNSDLQNRSLNYEQIATARSYYSDMLQTADETEIAGIRQTIEMLDAKKAALDNIGVATDENKKKMEALGQAVGDTMADVAVGLGEVIGSGEQGMKDLTVATLNSINRIIAGLLAQAIAHMITGEAHKGLIGLATATVGIAAITALFKSKVPEFANGGIVSGKTTAIVGEYAGARNNPEVIAPLSKLTELLGETGGGHVEFVIKGRDLHGVLNKQIAKNNSY